MNDDNHQNHSDNGNPHCPLCLGRGEVYFELKRNKYFYYKCQNCEGVYLHSDFFVSPEKEKKIYQQHRNDVDNLGYQQFVSPLVNYISKHLPPSSLGLDFGSGTGPVTSYLLEKAGFNMKMFDPFFYPAENNLTYKYDFIVSCEVVEHFHHPQKEFIKLQKLLKAKAPLVISTALLTSDINFEDWYYIRDPSHVFFYQEKTFEWISKNLGFSHFEIFGPRMIVLIK